MKLSKDEAQKMQAQGVKQFSKLQDFNPPDSPMKKVEEDDDPNAPNKFDQLMKAACSIKTAQLDQQKKKFDLLPMFLKAGVYYTQRHEVVRRQENFHVKYFTYEILSSDANCEFAQGNFDRACRRYEEALGVFRYYEATDPSWQEKGIDDDHL